MNERDLFVAISNLQLYSLAHSTGNLGAKFLPTNEDIAGYFPERLPECSHCNNPATSLTLFVACRQIVARATDSESRTRLAFGIRALEQVDAQIRTFVVLHAVRAQWDVAELSAFGIHALVWQCSAALANRIGINFLDTYRMVTNVLHPVFQGFDLTVSINLKKYDFHLRIWNAVNAPLSIVLDEVSERFQSNLSQLSTSTLQIIASRLSTEGQLEDADKWLRLLSKSRNQNLRFEYSALAVYTKHSTPISNEILNLFAPTILDSTEKRNVLELVAYLEATGDSVVSHRFYDAFFTQGAYISEDALAVIVNHWIRTGNRTELVRCAESPSVLRGFTLSLLFVIDSLRGEFSGIVSTLRENIMRFALENPKKSDFFLLMFAIRAIDNAGSDMDTRVKILARDFAAGYVPMDSRGDNIRRSAVAALYAVFDFDPKLFHAVARELLELLPRQIGLISALESNESPEPKSANFTTPDVMFGFQGALDYLLFEHYFTTANISRIQRIFVLMAQNSLTPLESQLRKFVMLISKQFDEASLAKALIGLRELSPEFAGKTELAVNRAIPILVYEFRGEAYGKDLARAAMSGGIRLDQRATTLYIEQDWVGGGLFDTGSLQGISSEYWGQLAIIFEEVVHELTQPLAATIATLEALTLAGPLGVSEEVRAKAIENARNYAISLGQRLLHYRTLASDGGTSQWIDLKDFAEQVLNEQLDFARLNNVELELTSNQLGSGRYVFGPPLQLRIAFQNLIRNAIKALSQVERDRNVAINLSNLRYDDEFVFIRISDNGPGISDEIQSLIFTSGFTTKIGHGLGLGLSLAASTVAGMGGQLKLENSDKNGSTFLIVLPCNKEPKGVVDQSPDDSIDMQMTGE
jgi:signal transduction histidine kinase